MFCHEHPHSGIKTDLNSKRTPWLWRRSFIQFSTKLWQRRELRGYSYTFNAVFRSQAEVSTDRGYSVREQLPLPTKPPFTVHLGNMSFDATEGDIHDFFQECRVTNVRIVEDKLDRKPKGFGYVEFATLEGLKKALDFNGTQFQGRNIRVSVAEPRKTTRPFSSPIKALPLNLAN